MTSMKTVQLICMVPSLVITSVPKGAASPSSAASPAHSSGEMVAWLLHLLFYSSTLDSSSASSSGFLSYVETPHELSIVFDERLLAAAPTRDGLSCALEHDALRWRALQVASAGAGGAFLTQLGILTELTSQLARHGISVFQISTYQTDYILVKTEELARAIDCLRSFCDIDMETGDDVESADASDAIKEGDVATGIELTESESEAEVDQPLGPTRSHALSAPHLDLFLVQLDRACARRHMYALVRLLFVRLEQQALVIHDAGADEVDAVGKTRFVSFSKSGDDISVVTADDTFVAEMRALEYAGEQGVMVSPDSWRVVQIGEENLGFTETGIVAAHTRVLLRAGTMVFYLSTFSLDFMLVKEDEWGDALESLQQHSRLVEGRFLPLRTSSISEQNIDKSPEAQVSADIDPTEEEQDE